MEEMLPITLVISGSHHAFLADVIPHTLRSPCCSMRPDRHPQRLHHQRACDTDRCEDQCTRPCQDQCSQYLTTRHKPSMLAFAGIFVRVLHSDPTIFADIVTSQMTRSDKKTS